LFGFKLNTMASSSASWYKLRLLSFLSILFALPWRERGLPDPALSFTPFFYPGVDYSEACVIGVPVSLLFPFEDKKDPAWITISSTAYVAANLVFWWLFLTPLLLLALILCPIRSSKFYWSLFIY
jgi:hypothetical protein